MTKFKITYTNPKTEEREVVEAEFTDTPANPGIHGAVSAREWAEDCAYMLGDKRMDYKIVQLP